MKYKCKEKRNGGGGGLVNWIVFNKYAINNVLSSTRVWLQKSDSTLSVLNNPKYTINQNSVIQFTVIKLLDGTEVTYAMEADALNHHLKTVDIYTNSWGPKEKDGYFELNGVTESAFIDGVTMVSME